MSDDWDENIDYNKQVECCKCGKEFYAMTHNAGWFVGGRWWCLACDERRAAESCARGAG